MAAALLEKVGRLGQARGLLQELIARRPDFAPAYLALGDVYFRRSEFADAQQSYRRFLTYDPAHEGALTNFGISAINTGQLAEAIEALQRVVDAPPQHASRTVTWRSRSPTPAGLTGRWRTSKKPRPSRPRTRRFKSCPNSF